MAHTIIHLLVHTCMQASTYVLLCTFIEFSNTCVFILWVSECFRVCVRECVRVVYVWTWNTAVVAWMNFLQFFFVVFFLLHYNFGRLESLKILWFVVTKHMMNVRIRVCSRKWTIVTVWNGLVCPWLGPIFTMINSIELHLMKKKTKSKREKKK